MALDILKNRKVEDFKGVHLFHHPSSNNAFRARLLLEEKQISWESHIVHLNKFEQFSKEYLAINPQGSVPTLIHDGIAIYGSENVMKYLESRFSENSFIPYPELGKETWNWVESATRTHINSIVCHLYAKGFGRPARKDKLHFYKKSNQDKYQFLINKGYHMTKEQKEEALTIVKLQMHRLEMSLQNHTYILGDKISMADIAWAPNIVFLEFLYFDFSNYPKIIEWVEKIKKRPSFNEKSEMPKYTSILVKLYFKLLLMTKSYLK